MLGLAVSKRGGDDGDRLALAVVVGSGGTRMIRMARRVRGHTATNTKLYSKLHTGGVGKPRACDGNNVVSRWVSQILRSVERRVRCRTISIAVVALRCFESRTVELETATAVQFVAM